MILTAGGIKSADTAILTSRILLKEMNVTEKFPCVLVKNTDIHPAITNTGILAEIKILAQFLNYR